MYKTIEAECILANLLHKYQQIRIRDLNRARAEIEKAVSSVYVDVTKNSLIRAVNRRPEMFEWEDHVFRRRKEWPAAEVEESFNWQIPANIRQKVLQVLDNITV